jgi:hypothetical protein
MLIVRRDGRVCVAVTAMIEYAVRMRQFDTQQQLDAVAADAWMRSICRIASPGAGAPACRGAVR